MSFASKAPPIFVLPKRAFSSSYYAVCPRPNEIDPLRVYCRALVQGDWSKSIGSLGSPIAFVFEDHLSKTVAKPQRGYCDCPSMTASTAMAQAGLSASTLSTRGPDSSIGWRPKISTNCVMKTLRLECGYHTISWLKVEAFSQNFSAQQTLTYQLTIRRRASDHF